MSQYSEQDLKYASEFREGVHREALAIVRKTRPNITEVVDRHPVEDYFQANWDYPGKWYAIVAIPSGYGSRKALVDAIVRDTLAGKAPGTEPADTQELRDTAKTEPEEAPKREEDPFFALLAEHPRCVIDYRIVPGSSSSCRGCEAHRLALKQAFQTLSEDDWDCVYDMIAARGKQIGVGELFAPIREAEELNYRGAFLHPPHGVRYTDADFDRLNAALFPKGTEDLEVYRWTTDWSNYFDEGHEWWGALCLTVYDKQMGRYAVILASATD